MGSLLQGHKRRETLQRVSSCRGACTHSVTSRRGKHSPNIGLLLVLYYGHAAILQYFRSHASCHLHVKATDLQVLGEIHCSIRALPQDAVLQQLVRRREIRLSLRTIQVGRIVAACGAKRQLQLILLPKPYKDSIQLLSVAPVVQLVTSKPSDVRT